MNSDDATPADLGGQFLIAETELQDPNFFRAVVLVIHHTAEGAFGLVVNRESEVTVGEVLDSVEGTALEDAPVFVGGPVQQNYVFALHNGIPSPYRSEHTEEPTPGVFFEPSFGHVIDYVKSEDYLPAIRPEAPRIRVFAGYSGWAAGQLEAELQDEAWFINHATGDVIFQAEPSEGWKQALSKKGGFYRIVAETGFKPSNN
ncbi:MAG: YqgE/AlgH family protein [Alkalispirochaeta sp.]